MRIAFVLPQDLEERLVAHAERHGHTIVGRNLTAPALVAQVDDLAGEWVAGPLVAIVAATETSLPERLLTTCDELGVRIVALAASDGERRYAAALGLRETADATSDWPEIERMLVTAPVPGLGATRAVAPQASDDVQATAAPGRGVVVAVWGPTGAPGRTTLAISLAAELSAAGRSVVLADLDTYGGSIALALGLDDERSGIATACRLAGADTLTLTDFELVAQVCPTGTGRFRVLTGIGSPALCPDLSPSRVEAVIERCRGWVDYVVIDTGFNLESDEVVTTGAQGPVAPGRNAATIAALRASDRVIAVGAADPIGVSRLLRGYATLVETVPADHVAVVMNKVRASALGSNPFGQLAEGLSRFGGIVAAAMIPFDPVGPDAAILDAQPLADAAPHSPARLAIRELVATIFVPSRSSSRRRKRRRARSA